MKKNNASILPPSKKFFINLLYLWAVGSCIDYITSWLVFGFKIAPLGSQASIHYYTVLINSLFDANNNEINKKLICVAYNEKIDNCQLFLHCLSSEIFWNKILHEILFNFFISTSFRTTLRLLIFSSLISTLKLTKPKSSSLTASSPKVLWIWRAVFVVKIALLWFNWE